MRRRPYAGLSRRDRELDAAAMAARAAEVAPLICPEPPLQPDVIRKLSRDALAHHLDQRGVDHNADDSDDELRTKLLNHEAAQACPYWG